MMQLEIALQGNREMQRRLTDLAKAIAAESDEMRQVEVGIGQEALIILNEITPIITGSLRSAHAIFVDAQDTYIALNKQATNPTSDEDPWQYGPELHARGGLSRSGHDRAFYDNLVDNYAEGLLDVGEGLILSLEVFK